MKQASEAGEVNIFRLSSGEYIIIQRHPYSTSFACAPRVEKYATVMIEEESRRIYCRLNVGC